MEPKLPGSPPVRKLKDEFLSLAAHEIRTPITVIKAQAQLAARIHAQGEFHGEIVDKCLKTFVRESDRLARLCTDLLDVARLDNGTLEVRVVPFEITKLIDAVMLKMLDKSALHEIVLGELDFAMVAADPERTEHVMMNLLANAIRYSPNGGKIMLSARTQDEFIEVTVGDEGLGIPADKLTKVFERYFQAHQTGLKGPCGLGIGLYLCRELVERMGGAIHAKSDGLGHGAKFIFTLPIKKAISQ
jgi:signal transduction histidine kinase